MHLSTTTMKLMKVALDFEELVAIEGPTGSMVNDVILYILHITYYINYMILYMI